MSMERKLGALECVQDELVLETLAPPPPQSTGSSAAGPMIGGGAPSYGYNGLLGVLHARPPSPQNEGSLRTLGAKGSSTAAAGAFPRRLLLFIGVFHFLTLIVFAHKKFGICRK
ncbi:hypothetical protein MVEN_00047600 [Mycena venus]|uniref:Uncharacterized protein n=1 Tax=Mycena venus TaxID=2733690 RepID=A0A8H6Z8V1_9AGAR|nr:hypothetical protein MVEN_00047600 [Mycena venus]